LTGERVERRLAAVLAADVAGYSRLMGADEEGTLAGLKSFRKTLVDPTIAAHRGRIVKTTGDGMLVEFASAVDAARCAVEVQRGMAGQNADVPQEVRLEFRIGIHVGDIIIIDDNDIFGDGVNIAARLEGIAEPGGVCISDDAQRQVRGKVDFVFDDMGPRTLKNIAEPMRAWRVRLDGNASSTVPAKATIESVQPLALPDRPSLAVLPFQNMSGDPEQEYFADGMVEDIITALSRVKSFFVIARNSSFTYKGKAIDIKQVGRELGVRYVLEGSVRKAGGKVRITGQLIEAATGHHVWADRFDGNLEDVFDLQDRVTESVVGVIEPSLRQAEIGRARAKSTASLDAYDCYLRALHAFYQLTREGTESAGEYLKLAIEKDPQFALAKALLAFCYLTGQLQGWGQPNDRTHALELAQDTVNQEPDDPSTLRCAGHAFAFFGHHDRGLALLEKAAGLNVNGSQVLNSLGWVKNYACVEPDHAIAHFERAIRLSPRDPEMTPMLNGIALAHLIAGRNEQALVFAQRNIDISPQFTSGYRMKIMALGNLGHWQEAKAAADVLLTHDPGFTISSRAPAFRDPGFKQRYWDALKAAGLPE
jgi:TolB-like protein/class 3 adenylate cyclase/Tfp pilus assembly protein PilF